MSKKNKNPYRAGSAYHAIFAVWQKKQIVTEHELIELGHKKADISVVVRSPRESSARGDCRGNYSCKGEFYFADLLKRQKVDGVKQPQKYRLRWRPVPLDARKRGEKLGVEARKVEATENVEQKTPAKSKAKAKA